MPDAIVARGSDSKFKPHPDGQYVAQCVDTIDLGENVETYAGQPSKLAHKCAIVFRTGERNEQTGEYIDIGREFTVSMGDKANLRKFLEQWRGRPYTAEEVGAGVPLHKLAGNHGLITVAHKLSGAQKTYATITACVGIPKQMKGATTTYTDYARDEYWTKKKQEYAAAVAKFRATPGSAEPDDDDFPHDFENGNETDDSFPF